MRLILIGTDRTLFTPESAVRQRIASFGAQHTDALDSIVFSTRSHGIKGSQELAPNVHAHPTNSFSRLLYGWDAFRVARHLPRPDAVSAQDPFETGLAALLIARYFRVPLVVEIHTDFLSPAFLRQSLLNRLRVVIARFVLARAAGGYAVSQTIRERVLARYRRAPVLAVFPIYVDTKYFASLTHVPHPRFGTALLWVGRMEPEKDPGLALEALARARQEGLDVGLTFVGGGRLLAVLKARAHKLGLDDRVEFTGAMVPDVSSYYAHADLLLVTSRYEGYGMTIVEALAAGVPVLSTDVGIAREAGAVIAGSDYAGSLVDWLRGSNPRGLLKLHPYVNEEEYFLKIRDYYEEQILHPRSGSLPNGRGD